MSGSIVRIEREDGHRYYAVELPNKETIRAVRYDVLMEKIREHHDAHPNDGWWMYGHTEEALRFRRYEPEPEGDEA